MPVVLQTWAATLARQVTPFSVMNSGTTDRLQERTSLKKSPMITDEAGPTVCLGMKSLSWKVQTRKALIAVMLVRIKVTGMCKVRRRTISLKVISLTADVLTLDRSSPDAVGDVDGVGLV